MKSKILITGGLGYIGSNVLLQIANNTSDEIMIVDNLSNSSISTLQVLENLTKKKIKFYRADVTNYNEMKSIFSENKIDCIYHFAAFKSVEESIKNPIRYFHNNILSLLVLINIMDQFKVPKIIFSSSATVYSMKNNFPVSESGILEFSNPYGQTKIASEDLLIRASNSLGIKVGILRYFNPLGNTSDGFLGENYLNAHNVMPMILNSIRNNSPFSIFGNDYNTSDGTAIRDYIHVEDLSTAHVLLNKFMDSDDKLLNIFNVGLGEGTSVLELVKTFCKTNDVKIELDFKQRRDGDLPICFANPSKIKDELNWKPKKNIKDMCRDAFKFFMKNQFHS